jgi:hypothetical protein
VRTHGQTRGDIKLNAKFWHRQRIRSVVRRSQFLPHTFRKRLGCSVPQRSPKLNRIWFGLCIARRKSGLRSPRESSRSSDLECTRDAFIKDSRARKFFLVRLASRGRLFTRARNVYRAKRYAGGNPEEIFACSPKFPRDISARLAGRLFSWRPAASPLLKECMSLNINSGERYKARHTARLRGSHAGVMRHTEAWSNFLYAECRLERAQ